MKEQFRLLISTVPTEVEIEEGKVYTLDENEVSIWEEHGVKDIDKLINDERIEIDYDTPFSALDKCFKGVFNGHRAVF